MRLGPVHSVQVLVAALAVFVAVPAHARDEAKVLVVPVHGPAGKGFDAAVVRLVAKPLKRHATVLPPAAYRPALKRARVGLNGLRAGKGAQKVGRAAGAAYILVVQAGGKRPHLVANATLTDVASGQTLFSDRYALVGGKLTAEVAAQMLSPVADKLAGGSDAGDAGDDAVADAGAAAGKKKKAGKGGKFAFPSGAGDKSSEGGDDAGGDGAAGSDADADADAAAEDKPKGPHGPRWRPGLRLALGATFMRRTGTLSGVLPPNITKLPCYCGEGNAANPFFPGVQLHVELFPWALGGTGESLLEGLGLELEFFATQIKSWITYYAADGTVAQPKSVVTSVVLDLRAHAKYRFVFWDSAVAPDLEARAGVSIFSFPLHNGTFPGVAYTAPSLGLEAHVPLGIEQVALLGGINFLPAVLAGDDAGDKVNQMLGLESGGSGLLAMGGLRFAFDNYEIHALLRYESYTLKYTGETHLAINPNNNEKQLSNIGLKDSLLQITLTAGMVF